MIGDCGEPGAERSGRIISVPYCVEGQQNILDRVLGIAGVAMAACGKGA